MGHRHRRLGRARQHLRGQPATDLDEAIAEGDRAVASRADGCATLVAGTDPRPGATPALREQLRRHARLRGRPARTLGAYRDDGAAPRAVARHRRRRRHAGGSRPRQRVTTASARRSTWRATAATWTCPRTTSPPPTSARERADRDLADGVAGPCCAAVAGPAARARPDPHRAHPRPHRTHPVARPRSGVAVAGGGAARWPRWCGAGWC